MLVDLSRTVIAAIAAAAMVGVPVVVVVAILARVRQRGTRGLLGAGALAVGLVLGFALLVTEAAPPIRTTTILLVIGLVIGLWAANRLIAAGLLLIGAAGPWLLYFGAVLLDLLLDARLGDPWRVIPPFVTGLVGVAVGGALVKFQVDWNRRHPTAPAIAEPVRRWDAASRAALGPTLGGMNLAGLAATVVLLLGMQASAIVGHGRPVLESLLVVVVGSLLTGLAGIATWTVAWPPRARRAFEAFVWLGEHDLDRAAAIIEDRPTFSNLKRYVRNTPERVEDRWLRVEALAAMGDVDETHAIAQRLPDDTPIARVERASLLGYANWLRGGDAHIEAIREAVDAVEPADGDDRLRAEVALALADVRRLVAGGDPDPASPLRAVRDRLGSRADGVLWLAGRRQLEGFFKIAVAGVILLTLIDRALSAGGPLG